MQYAFRTDLYHVAFSACAFIALTMLVRHQEEHQAWKNWVLRCWHGYLSAVRCKWFAYGLANDCHPSASCFIKIQTGLTFLVLAYPGCPGKEAIKWVSVLYHVAKNFSMSNNFTHQRHLLTACSWSRSELMSWSFSVSQRSRAVCSWPSELRVAVKSCRSCVMRDDWSLMMPFCWLTICLNFSFANAASFTENKTFSSTLIYVSSEANSDANNIFFLFAEAQDQPCIEHLLTFRIRCYVVIAMKPVHWLQIRPIVHN